MLGKKVLVSLIVLFALCTAGYGLAAEHYIRAGAAGDSSGRDWQNAFPSWPKQFIRGDTYWVASGEYSGALFNTKGSANNLYITIRKATAAKHGTAEGWKAEYGDGEAHLGPITFTTSFWILDGQTRGADWKSDYGFRIKNRPGNRKAINLEGGPDYITIRYVEVEGNGVDNSDHDVALYGAERWEPSFKAPTNITIQYCYFHDVGGPVVLSGRWNKVLAEYNLFARNSSDALQHAEGWADSGSNYVTIRNNRFEDIEGTAFIAVLSRGDKAIVKATNWTIVGNAFYYTPDNRSRRDGVGNGAIAVINWQQAQNWAIQNNVFVNIQAGNSARIALETERKNKHSNVRVRGNLWYNCKNVDHFNVTASGNYYFDSTKYKLASGDKTGKGDPFVDWKAGDFKIKSDLRASVRLQAPFR